MLAVIIPFYKLNFFEDTLKSLANQTSKNFNVYIGDDASPEDCKALLTKFEGKFNFLYHRFDYNMGAISLTKQWERCISLSFNEEWLMVLGDDDVLGVNVVEEFDKLMNIHNDKISLIRFNLSVIDSNSKIYDRGFSHNPLETMSDLLEVILLMQETITASEFIFSRKVYHKNKGFVEFPLAWFSDYATWLLFSKENGLHNVNNASVFWRLSEVNISSQILEKKTIHLKIKSLFLFLSFLQENFNLNEKRLKIFTRSKINDFSYQLSFFYVIKILLKEIFTYKLNFTIALVVEMVFKKIKRNCKKKYESFCSTLKR